MRNEAHQKISIVSLSPSGDGENSLPLVEEKWKAKKPLLRRRRAALFELSLSAALVRGGLEIRGFRR